MPDERRPMPPGEPIEPGDEPDEAMVPGAERFEHYLDALLGGERPSPDDVADRDEAEMARLAAELSAAADPDEGAPDPAFLDQLRLRMRQADQGIATVQEPLPLRPTGAAAGRVRITRRQLLQAGVIGAAGVAAGAAGIVLLRPEVAERAPIWDDGSGLVGADGEWVAGRVGQRRAGRRRRCASARRPSTATWSMTTARSARCRRSAPTWAARCSSGRTGATCAAPATAPAST